MRLAIIAAALMTAACQGDDRLDDVDARMEDLEQRVLDLETARDSVTVAELSEQFDLVIAWPGADAPQHRTYDTQDACERAKAVIVDDNARRKAEAEAKVGSRLPGGARIIAAASPELPSAVCVPL